MPNKAKWVEGEKGRGKEEASMEVLGLLLCMVTRSYSFTAFCIVKGDSAEEYLRGREEKKKGKVAHRRVGRGTI